MNRVIMWLIGIMLAMTSSVVLSGCTGSTALVSSTKAGEMYGYVGTLNAAVRTAAAKGVQSKLISKDLGRSVLQRTDQVRLLLDESMDVARANRDTKLFEALDLTFKLVNELRGKGIPVDMPESVPATKPPIPGITIGSEVPAR